MLVPRERYIITTSMTDTTTHDEAKPLDAPVGARSRGGTMEASRATPWRVGVSMLALSAGARLMGVALALAALWAGVYWALH